MVINIDGLNIAYEIKGETGEYAVMLQGWGTSYKVYDSVANYLSAKYRVVLLDLPGFGESDEPAEGWNVDAYADFFEKFMKALGIDRAILLGHSYGGRVIIKLANRNDIPFEIDKIILIDSAGIVPKKTFKQKFKIKRYKMLKAFFNIKPVYWMFKDIVDAWKSGQGSEDYRNASPIMKKCMVMAVNEDLTHMLSGIKQDTLLVWGDKDTATPITDAHIMEREIPNSGLAIIPGTGHYSFLEQPVLFRSILDAYLG